MLANNLPLLPSLNLHWMPLRNEFSRCFLALRNKSGSKIARFLCAYPILVSNNLFNSTTVNHIFTSLNTHTSRYSVSTTMKPQTKVFSFNDYDVIGLDLDGTILRYNLSEMVPLEYELLSRYLVEHKGYSEKVLKCNSSSMDKDFFQKGLFLDAERGNILKLRHDGYIIKACHGTKHMYDENIADVYGKDRRWSVTTQFVEDPLCSWNGPLSEKLRSLLDYFDLSASLVFANAVDDVDSARKYNEGNNQPYRVWPDILEALIRIYTRENFSNGKSEYFEKLKKEPERFLLKTSPLVINWLKELKGSKKKLYLLTGSHIDFANFTASYAIGDNWRDLFDVVICFARKPGFFHASRSFYKIEGYVETDPVRLDENLQMNEVYSMGNWEQLLKLFAKEIGKETIKVKSLYIGDNLIQDVYTPTALSCIDTVAISEEMLSERLAGNDFDPENFDFRDVIASRYWNSYFFVNGEPTLWTSVIAKYSKMCLPTLEHAASKPIDYEYCMQNEQGFYPSGPIVE